MTTDTAVYEPDISLVAALWHFIENSGTTEEFFELRTRVFVTKLVHDKQAKRVTGVLYTDLKTGEEFEQPASIDLTKAKRPASPSFALR